MRELLDARCLVVYLAMFLTACGGSGVDFRNGSTGPTDPDTDQIEAEARLAELLIIPSSNQLANDADDPTDEGLTLTIVALDANRVVLPNVRIALTATKQNGSGGDGVISFPAFAGAQAEPATDETGTLLAILTTGGDATERNIVVQAANGSIRSLPLIISVVDPAAVTTGLPVAQIKLVADNDTLSSDADTVAEGIALTVFATDERGNTVEDVDIEFFVTDLLGSNAPSLGAVTVQQRRTDNAGTARAVLTTGGNPESRQFRVKAVVANDSQIAASSVTITVPGTNSSLASLDLFSSAKQILNSGSDTITLTAIAKDADNNALVNAPLRFQANQGVLTPGGVILTNANGVASVTLSAGGVADGSQIQVSLSGVDTNLSRSLMIGVVQDPADVDPATEVSTLRLFANQDILAADADTEEEGIALAAVVTDAAGNTVPGVAVSFALTDLNGQVVSNQGALTVANFVSDESGIVRAVLTTGGNATARQFQVRVEIAGNANVPSSSVMVTVPGTNDGLASLDLLSSSTQVLNTGDNSLTLTAIAKDGNNNALAGAALRFRTTAGVLSPGGVLLTGADGRVVSALSAGGVAAGTSITVTLEAVDSNVNPMTTSVAVIADTPEPTPAFISLLAATPTMGTEADSVAEGMELTALVRDSAGILLAGEAVSFSVVGGQAALSVTQGVTDGSGVARAVLTTAGDPTNRNVTVRAMAGAVSTAVEIQIIGTNMTISGANSIGDGDSTILTARLVNGAGEGIANQTVNLSVVDGSGSVEVDPVSGVTDSSGRLEFEVIGRSAGTAQIIADASPLGTTLARPTFDVTVAGFSLAFGFPDADGELALGATVPVTVRLSGADCASSTQVDAACNSSGNPVVRFAATRGTLFPSGTLSPGGFVATANAPFRDDQLPTGTLDATDTSADGVATVDLSSDFADGSGPVQITATGPGGSSASLNLEFVATSPDSVEVQAEPNTVPLNGTSQIEVRVRDASENPVKNELVEFSLKDSTGGKLSATSRITDSLGRAFVTYTATSLTSGKDGVTVTASLPQRPAVASAQVQLTVSGGALRIILGTGNELSQNSPTSYAMPWSVIVTDSSGNPAPASTVFRLSYEPLRFGKGFYTCPEEGKPWVRNVVQVCEDEDLDNDFINDFLYDEDIDNDGNLDVNEDANGNGVLDVAEIDVDGDGRADPANEDLDNDGRLDLGEDLNSNGVLDVGEDLNGDGLLATDEDLNFNGVQDPGEDLDGDGKLDIGEDLNADGVLDQEDTDCDGNLDVNEDTNGNGVLDDGEDIDGDGRLDLAREDVNFNGRLDHEDVDCDGVLDPNEDLNGNGRFDIALGEDIDGDGRFDIGEDLNGNGVLDPGEDVDGDGVLDLNEDLNGNLRFDPAEDLDGDGNFDRVFEDLDRDGNLDVLEDLNGNGILDAGEDLDGDGKLDTVDEDQFYAGNPNVPVSIVGNGRLDIAEDTNQDGVLTPGNVVSLPSTIELDENGFGEFNLIYAEQYAGWVRIRLRAVASVGGTETTAIQTFDLPGIASDFANCPETSPPGSPSPFGFIATCLTAD